MPALRLPADCAVGARRRARPRGDGDEGDRTGRRRACVRRSARRRRDPLGGQAVKLPPPVAELIGIEVERAEAGETLMTLVAEERHSNPMGTVHGGILCDLADAAMGMAWFSTLEPGESFTTLELKINFLRPFWTGKLVARGRVVQRGRTVGMAECDVFDDQERLIARASSTCMTLRGEMASGR